MTSALVKAVILPCLAACSMCALAQYPEKESDFAALPPYCKVKIFYGAGSPQYKKWKQRMGHDTFAAVHHYCAALFEMNHAYTDQKQRAFLLQNALGNIAYMEKKVPKTSPLMPEVLMKKGKILLMQGREPEALMAFHSSVMLNKRYAPAYMAIADYYISKDLEEEAMEIIEEGLQYAPKSKGLKRRQDKVNSESQ